MQTVVEGATYKSRPKLLLSFFKRSRDGWKRKCKKAKEQLKLAKNQNRAVEKSRARWKSRAKELEAELEQVRRELQEQKGRHSHVPRVSSPGRADRSRFSALPGPPFLLRRGDWSVSPNGDLGGDEHPKCGGGTQAVRFFSAVRGTDALCQFWSFVAAACRAV